MTPSRYTPLCAALALALITGCYSSKYIPQSRGRVSIAMQQNQQVYVRDGRIIKHGVFGSGLRKAVRGNPAAERAAHEFYKRQKDGFLTAIGGLLCSGVAAGIAIADSIDDPSNTPVTPLLVSIGCVVVAYGGLFYMVSATPYRFDAINLFNDGYGMPRERTPGSFAPGASGANPPEPARDSSPGFADVIK